MQLSTSALYSDDNLHVLVSYRKKVSDKSYIKEKTFILLNILNAAISKVLC